MTSSYTISDETPTSYAYVFSNWLRSLRVSNDYFKLMKPRDFYTPYHNYIERLLINPITTIRFALLTEDKDVILGFSVFQKTILHYVYVQKNMRRQGIAKSLVPKDIDTITHLTKIGLNIWSNKYPKVTFNPFAEL